MRCVFLYMLPVVSVVGLLANPVEGFAVLDGIYEYENTVAQYNTYTQRSTSEQIMERFSAKMEEHSSVEMCFTFSGADKYGGALGILEGTIYRQGADYAMLNRQIEVYAFGDTKWIYMVENNEAMVMLHEPTSIDVAENPLALFSAQLSKEYSFSNNPNYYIEEELEVVEICLTPKGKKLPYASIFLRIYSQSLTPHSIKYHATDGSWYEATITAYTHRDQSFPPEQFTFSSKNHPGVYITDLR